MPSDFRRRRRPGQGLDANEVNQLVAHTEDITRRLYGVEQEVQSVNTAWDNTILARVVGFEDEDEEDGGRRAYKCQWVHPSETLTAGRTNRWQLGTLTAHEYSDARDVPVDGSAIVLLRPDDTGGFYFDWHPTELDAEIISSAAGVYQCEQRFPDQSGTWANGTLTLEAREDNGRTDVANGTIVRVRRGYCSGAPRVEIDTLQDGDDDTLYDQQTVGIFASGGTYKLIFDETSGGTNPQTTGPIAWNANATTVEAALTSLSNCNAVGITGNGTLEDRFTIEFLDSHANYLVMESVETDLEGDQEWLFSAGESIADVEFPQDEIPVRITEKSGFAHGFVEQEQLENGTMEDKAGGFSGNLTANTLYERNERTDVPINTTVMAWPGFGWNPRVEIGTAQNGNGTIPEIHSVAVLEAAGGNFTLAYTANTSAPLTYQTTGALAWNANATTIETALEGLSNLGNLTVSGNGTEADPFLIEHDDDNDDHLPLVADYENLVGERLWQFGYTPPSSANTTLDELTVTSILTSENNTILGGQINVENATTINYAGNNSFTLGIATFYFGGAVNQTFAAAVNQTFNASIEATFNGNVTYTFVGAIGFTICGNTTWCANKTLTLPTIIGNKTGSVPLNFVPNMTANAAVPSQMAIENATVVLTGITGTPTTPASGSYGLFVDDATGQLSLIDDGGTEYPVGITGSGTSAGAEGDVQIVSPTPGDFDFENGGPTYIFRYDKSTHVLTIPGLKIVPVPGGGGTLYIDGSGDVDADTDGSATNYTVAVSSDWDSTDPTNVKDALDRLAAAVAGLLGTAIP